jgi:regulator of replication initiation timing
MAEQASLTNVLESLVNDNNTLKHDNAELQNLLVESREETYLLQQEVEEHRANPPSRAGGRY